MNKQCQNCKNEFEITDEDTAFYRKIDVPPPTWCPECRVQRRMAWRNEINLYKRTSDLAGDSIISQYPSKTPFPVYSPKEYFEREWKPPELTYDPSKSFLEQFRELQLKTPRNALLTDLQSIEAGSIYQNAASRNKNCYMVSAAGDNEDCMYSNNLDYSKSSIDCLWCRRVEYTYECVDSLDCNKLFFSEECRQCVDSWFLYDCINCMNCFGCVGLRNKSYCLWNKQLSKEEYEREIDKLLKPLTFNDVKMFKNKLEDLKMSFPRKYAHIDVNSSPTCTGDYIVDSQNVIDGFAVHQSQNAHYCSKLISGKECWDITDWGDTAELCYESITVGKGAYKVMFSNNCWPECREIEYCDSCANSHHLFGCVGLKDASYRILNKEYSEEEYKRLKNDIVADMKERNEYGEFFPIEYSPFAYNQAIAQDHFPLTADKAKAKGYAWQATDEKKYSVDIPAEDIPTDIDGVSEDILDKIIGCEHSGTCKDGCTTAFKITADELSFYRRFGLPLPRICFNCRHATRFNMRNPMKLWPRSCQCAGDKSDPPSRTGIKNKELGIKEFATDIETNQQPTTDNLQQGTEDIDNKESKTRGTYTNTSKNHPDHAQDEHCPNEFQTSYSPDRPEIIYCENCYQNEVT